MLNEERKEGAGRGGNIPPKEHQFKPGQSENPSDRPKGGIDYYLRKFLVAKDHHFAKQLATALLKHACGGNQTAFRELLSRN